MPLSATNQEGKVCALGAGSVIGYATASLVFFNILQHSSIQQELQRSCHSNHK